MFSKLTSLTLLPLLLTLTTAQAPTREQTITNAFLSCSNAPSSTCPLAYELDSCLVAILPNIWELYDTSHTSPSISSTPLASALQKDKSRLSSCVCQEAIFADLNSCMTCIRNETQLSGEIDFFGVGLVTEMLCGTVLSEFELDQGGRKDVQQDQVQETGRNETTTTTPPPVTGPKNETTTPPVTGPKNETTTTPLPGNNETVQTPTPTSSSDGSPDPSESSGAAVARVVRRVVGPAGMAAVVAVGMSLL